MVDFKIKTKLTDKNESQQAVSVKIFKITDIPDVMVQNGWVVSARFMRKWFNDSYFEMTKDHKLNKVDMSLIDKQHIVDDLDFEWLFNSSSRIKPVYEALIKKISEVAEYDGFLGRRKDVINQLSNGLCFIINKLDKLEIMENGEFKSCHLNFSDLTAIELEKKSQFNYIKIGSTLWEKATDDLDDVYGALGSFIIKVAFTDLHVTRDSSGFVRLEIKELGLYVRDTYDFINDGDDQLLGYWGSNGVIKPGVISELMKKRYIDKENKRYFRVTNSSFLSYRENFKNTNKSGDFFVYSTVKKIPTNIVIHLNKVDMEEYFSWRKENANG
ncbi:DUF6402 family protein [Erwinia amylovora]|uniref:DUF6402 family protein n=1 Tax=Erwinia amylovora TaxID=552 RepID=UPI0014445FB2|nr:DUF6402 family protein [Erwinia amylovora]